MRKVSFKQNCITTYHQNINEFPSLINDVDTALKSRGRKDNPSATYFDPNFSPSVTASKHSSSTTPIEF